MTTAAILDELTRDEQVELLHALVERLTPEPREDDPDEVAFPAWLVKELEAQDQRLRSGGEKSHAWEDVKARLMTDVLP